MVLDIAEVLTLECENRAVSPSVVLDIAEVLTLECENRAVSPSVVLDIAEVVLNKTRSQSICGVGHCRGLDVRM